MNRNSSPPLVAHVLPTLEQGGAERVVFELAARLPERGFAVHVIAMMGGGRLVSDFAHAGVPVSIFPKRGPWGSFGFFPTRRLLRELRPDIVHSHLFGADLWGRLAALASGVPVVVSTEHNMFPREGCAARILKRGLAIPTDALVAVSATVKKHMTAVEGLPSRKIRVIPNGIDFSRVIPRTARAFRDVPRLLTVGRLEPQKGQATLLKALALVKRPWSLDLVGTGALERDLKRLADRLGIAARVRFLGTRNDVPELLADADLFCFPSHWEGFGLAFVEAAAAGVPVVASDLDVFREIAGDNATFTPPGDVSALAEALHRLLADPGAAIAAAAELAPRLQSRYSIDRMVGATASLYRELLKT